MKPKPIRAWTSINILERNTLSFYAMRCTKEFARMQFDGQMVQVEIRPIPKKKVKR